MDTSTIILLVLLVAAATAYAVSLVATIRDDGLSQSRRRPPASHCRDLFDRGAGPTKLA